MPMFASTSLESLQNGYTEFVRYAYRYFDIDNVKTADLWHKLCRLGKEREEWKPIMLLIELFRCPPFSNAAPERSFSHFKFIKTGIRSRLSNKSLNSIMKIKMNNLSRGYFRLKVSPTSGRCPGWLICFKNLFHQNDCKETMDIGGGQIRGVFFKFFCSEKVFFFVSSRRCP